MLTRNPFIEPMIPAIVDVPPTGDQWRHEIKFDGFRVQIHLTKGQATIFSRNGHDFTRRFAGLQTVLTSLPVSDAVIDAELVACDESGQPNFKDLMRAGRTTTKLCCWAFDLLILERKDLRQQQLRTRRHSLRKLIIDADDQGLQYSLDFDDGAALLARANEMGLEGIVSKRQRSAYTSGRTREWVKVKTPSWRAANAQRGDLFKGRA